jgi:hypothetical protein
MIGERTTANLEVVHEEACQHFRNAGDHETREHIVKKTDASSKKRNTLPWTSCAMWPVTPLPNYQGANQLDANKGPACNIAKPLSIGGSGYRHRGLFARG